LGSREGRRRKMRIGKGEGREKERGKERKSKEGREER